MAVQMLRCLAQKSGVFLAGFWKKVEDGLLGGKLWEGRKAVLNFKSGWTSRLRRTEE